MTVDLGPTATPHPAPAPVPSRRAQEHVDVTIRGARVWLPDERRCADPDRPVRIEIAGVAYANLNAGEARRIAAALVAAAGVSQASEPAPPTLATDWPAISPGAPKPVGPWPAPQLAQGGEAGRG